MNYDFGCAAPLYEAGLHPRVMLGPDDLADLKQRTQEGPGKIILDALHQRMQPLAQRVLEAADLPVLIGQWARNWKQPATPIVQGLFDMALAGALREDGEIIEAVRRVILILPEAQQHFSLAARPGYNLPFSLAWAYDLLWDRFSPAERRVFTDWAVPTCVRGPMAMVRDRYFRAAGGNINQHGMDIPLGTILAIRGDEGVPDLEAELRDVLRMLQATLHVAISSDGYPEEDIGYGTVVTGRLAELAAAVRRAGLYDAYRDCPRLTQFGRAMLHFVQPWGLFLSNTGDHGDDFGHREFVLPRLATVTGDPTLLWLNGTLTYPSAGHDMHETNRRELREVTLSEAMPNVQATAMSLLALDDLAQPPAHPAGCDVPTAFRDRRRGIVSFRSDWDQDAAFVVFDGSQRSAASLGHAHDSCGHFSLSALGEYFAIDTGRYSVDQESHNITLIEGKSGRTTDGEWRMSYYHGALTDYQPGEFADYASVDSSHQHNCIWAHRHLGLVKGDRPYLWTVDDLNKAHQPSEYWWQMHTSPENVITLGEKSAQVKGWRHGNLLDVHFPLLDPVGWPDPHTLELTQDIAGPSSHKYVNGAESAKAAVRPSDMVHHAVYQRPRLIAKVAGPNGRFMALMLPRRAGEAPAKVEHLDSVLNSLAVRITFPEVEDVLIFAFDHQLLEAGDVVARGLWCVVRRSRQTGKVLAWQLVNGTSLTAGGERLV